MKCLEERKEFEYAVQDSETKRYLHFMCKKGCKFYDNGCTKKRVIRDCAKQGLKNKD